MTCTKSDSLSIQIAKEALLKGGIAVLPTDTVYGFSGIVDLKGRPLFNCEERIAHIKGRPEGKPLIHLIAEPEDIFLYADCDIPDSVLKKWPGALSVIVPVKKESPLYKECATVAFRCPGDEWLRRIIKDLGAPIYSTSVNRSGCAVLDSISEIQKEFDGDVDLIVDDGDKKCATPSTLISLAEGSVKVLRQGDVKI